MLRLIAGPTESVVTLAQARAQCRVDEVNTDEDATLLLYIVAATRRLDGGGGILGRCLRPQTWELIVPRFPAATQGSWHYPAGSYDIRGAIRLPLPPTISVLSVKYLDEAEVLQTLSPTLYRVTVPGDDEGAQIKPVIGATWPLTVQDAPDAVRVRFRAGYRSSDSPLASPEPNVVPEEIQQAILLTVGSWFENRSDDVVGTNAMPLPSGVAALIAPYRLIFEHEAV